MHDFSFFLVMSQNVFVLLLNVETDNTNKA